MVVPTVCQLCGRALTDGYVDGKTTIGFWTIMCLACHSVKGWGLGLGRGQRYHPDGTKIGG